ncbi:MAG: hypothetical protein HUJ68_04660 [Clostridia bacterium]|nr:hypothetical protein [Clostridia bacterium]
MAPQLLVFLILFIVIYKLVKVFKGKEAAEELTDDDHFMGCLFIFAILVSLYISFRL